MGARRRLIAPAVEEELGPFTSLSFPNSLFPPSFSLCHASSLFLCLANDSEELGWWMIYIKKKKHSIFFFWTGLPESTQGCLGLLSAYLLNCRETSFWRL